MGTKCPVCGYSIRKHGGIYKHIQDSEDAEHTAYAKGLKRCQTCHVTFKSTQGRSQHIKSCVPTLVQSGYGASGKREFSIRPSVRECQKRACSNDGQLSNKLARGNRTIERSAFAAQPHVDSQSTPAYSLNETNTNLEPASGIEHQSIQYASQISAPAPVKSYLRTHIPASGYETQEPAKEYSNVTISLVALLHSLGGSQIQQDVLFRGLLLQKRWNDSGDVHETTLHDAGLNEQVACLFSSQTKLEQAIESCIQLGLIERGVLVDGSLEYSISEQSRHLIYQSLKIDELHLLGLIFTTHIYPRDQTLEPSFQALGKLLLPLLERTWQYVQGEPRLTLPAYARESLVEASLATCRLAMSRAKDVMILIAAIQDPELPDHLQMAIANRNSVSLRFNGNHDQSDAVIQDILGSIALDSISIRSHCSYGRLLLSQTENAILRKEFGKALSYLTSWEVKSTPPSGLELQVVRLKNTVMGRLSRYKGEFKHASYCLEECLKTVPGDASRYHIMHHLADVYCELKIPEEAEKLVLDEVNRHRAQGKQRLRAFRRLALPLAEAYIEQGKLGAAKPILQELLNIFHGILNLDVADQLGHVRSMIGLARVDWYEARWPEACHSLQTSLVLTEKYPTFSKGNFYIGFIYLFLSAAHFELREDQEGQTTFATADEILREQMPRHFMPGIGSYFLHHLLQRRVVFAGLETQMMYSGGAARGL